MELGPPRFNSPLDDRVATALWWTLVGCVTVGTAHLGVALGLGLPAESTLPAGGVALLGFVVALGQLYRRNLAAAGAVASTAVLVASSVQAARYGGIAAFGLLLPNVLIALGVASIALHWRWVLALAASQMLFAIALLVAGQAELLPPVDHAALAARAPAYSLVVIALGGGALAAATSTFRSILAAQASSEAHLRDLLVLKQALNSPLRTANPRGVA